MAEAIGAFYAVETVVEGVAAGAWAVSGATVPLHAKFQRIKSPSQNLNVKGSTASIIKNKVYILGGEADQGHADHGVHVLSFPPDFGASRTDGSPLSNLDYQLEKPEYVSGNRPLEKYNDHLEKSTSVEKHRSHYSSWSRTKHALATINDQIYVLGGMDQVTLTSRQANTESIIPLDTVLVYDTLRSSCTLVPADPQKCTEGMPEPRYAASCTSSPYPLPAATVEVQGPSTDAHGTIFLHGGYGTAGLPLHDTWTFDVGTRAWHKFPTIVDTALQDKSVPGRIAYVDHRLWYTNGSTAMHLDLAEHDSENNEVASQDPAILSTGRVGSGQWQVVYPPPEIDPSAQSQKLESKKNEKDTEFKKDLPSAPTSHIIPITTGAGRTYLIHFSSRDPCSMYTFQIPSAQKTAASIKDTIRDKVTAATNLSDSWKSGKHEWSRVEVVQANKDQAMVEIPDKGLEDFAVCGWDDYGDKLIIWGGHEGGVEVKNEGWIVDLE
ncbi:hypothetical protein H2198_007048 [Neophaeococcomyces mojaviensis]|uniref:Uncharacterized protein n=1 Tax=Neophaeococcomyces mojaviensis TaxID=3383035 RepID=A0ACC3A177_9EURO|nr:hypothetical protein H2198_007048 [Knufia sp. JES_112]